MSPESQQRRQQLIRRILDEVRKRATGREAKVLTPFVEQFYERVPQDDLASQTPADRAGGALSMWELGVCRQPGEMLIRWLNPSRERDGWTSPHSIVEVINDDMPFIVDSVVNELARCGLTVHLTIHPILNVRRNRNGRLVELLPAATTARIDACAESFLHVEVAQQSRPQAMDDAVAGLQRVLRDVEAAVSDWAKMRSRIGSILAELDADPPPLADEELTESKDFLRWLDEGSFAFLGYREYRFQHRKQRLSLQAVRGSGLGTLRSDARSVFSKQQNHSTLPKDIDAFVKQPRLLMIGKSPHRATVHRNAFMDLVAVKQFDRHGKVVGEKVFAGLFTSAAYSRSLQLIPVLRRRVKYMLKVTATQPASHDGRALLHILETFPRDELFRISDTDLLDAATGILNLQGRHRTALFLWPDPFERFMSCLVFVPLARHHTVLRWRIQEILEQALGGPCRSFGTQFDQDSVLVRLHFVLETDPNAVLHHDRQAIEHEIAEAVRSWSDHLQDALVRAKGEAAGAVWMNRYATAFDAGYQAACDAGQAVVDIEHIERALDTGELQMDLYRGPGQEKFEVRFKIFHRARPVSLSDALPVLENLGLRVIEERPYRVTPRETEPVWIHDFGLQHVQGAEIDLAAVREQFHATFARVWSGEMENDAFNSLVLLAGLTWRQTIVLRACARFLRQVQVPFSESYMQQTLMNNGNLARRIVELFETQFMPGVDQGRAERIARLRETIHSDLDTVSSLDEDRVLRCFARVVAATLRTNYFQMTTDGQPKPYLALKINSQQLEGLPLPKPHVELFVYSPAVEALHLRFGHVARGGLRWSDRPEDFRTEILGLVKAQQIKNTVIVPVGSKGGFVAKRLPGDASREVAQQVGIACYQTFIRGLLDLTDNYQEGRVAPPPHVVRRDGDDPYLVVAADKGTATFSDIANEVAQEYGFWLGDAFASGGSTGYDHKKMGITARGAWEAVKRHFRELGKDIQEQAFTVVGVGDMSGDVFGNAMLLSRRIRLIAAFNHQHIFLDPDPDPERSYAERERLFKLPRSSWADYDLRVLSAGGAIYARTAKSISLSSAARKRLGLKRSKWTPGELIQMLLRADVDLLWFGGIGTYVKARRESAAEVGDRANDAVRVNGQDLRAKVIGEGANLAVTQLGRVEYALAGGRLNTDSVDNSAGVSCSDREVNIKILLATAERAGTLSRHQRNKLLEQMTDEVARRVIRDNYLQTGSLSVTKFIEQRLTDRLLNFMRDLERAGHLNRELEHLPDEEMVVERKARKIGFTRPELCILMAYAKIVLKQQLLESRFPDEPFMAEELAQYFPKPLRERFGEEINQHPLRREMIVTMVANSIVNRVGIVFAHEVRNKTGKKACDVARGYVTCRRIFEIRRVWADIAALDNQVPAATQAEMLRETGRLMDRATTWFLTHVAQPLDIATNIARFGSPVRQVITGLNAMLNDAGRKAWLERSERLMQEGVPEELARRVASLRWLVSACDIARVSEETGCGVERAGSVYFLVGDCLTLDWLRRQAAQLPVDSHWDSQAATAIVDDLFHHQYRLTTTLLNQANPGEEPQQLLERCRREQAGIMAAATQTIQELRTANSVNLAQLAVVSRQLRRLVAE